MDRDVLSSEWDHLKHKFKAQWGKLSDTELDQIGGNRERLVSSVSAKYGIAQDEAARQVDAVARGHHAGDEPA